MKRASPGFILIALALLLNGGAQLSVRAAPIEQPASAISPDPLIQSMIDQVSPDTVETYVGGLSGEWPVIIGGQPYTLLTRYTYSGEPIQKATQFVYEHFEDLGLAASYHVWNGVNYPNVIGEQPGVGQADRIFLIAAHLDSTSNTPNTYAPGADDNASGATAVLIAADILSQYSFDCTLRYALFTGEEQGLLGSEVYAEQTQSESIEAVLNLDMIAWNTPGSIPEIDLYARSGYPDELALVSLFADVIEAYDIDLTPEIRLETVDASDHASFWAYGVPAILGIEDFSDFNPYYHSTDDQLENLDLAYFTEFVKASVGTFAHIGCPNARLGTLRGVVSDAQSGSPIAGAWVRAGPPPTLNRTTTTNGAGEYSLDLTPGSYQVDVWAPGYALGSTFDVVISETQTTTLDITLEAAPNYPIYLPIVTKIGS
jgi:hypothetical protein